MKKQYISILLAVSVLLTGCGIPNHSAKETSTDETQALESKPAEEISYRVIPETFSLELLSQEESYFVSTPKEPYQVENLKKEGSATTWFYPDRHMEVSIKPVNNYLEVCLVNEDSGDNSFVWPVVKGEQYYIPLGEGKRIPGDDKIWADYLTGMDFTVMSNLSMPMFSVVLGDKAVVYIMEHPFRTNINFTNQDGIGFHLSHEYPQIDSVKEKKFRIYLTDANPVNIAGIYKSYVEEQGKLVTLEEKAKTNENIRKLYGAPHIYFWGERALSPEDIRWDNFRKAISGKIIQHLLSVVSPTEEGAEFQKVLERISEQDYVDQYQKNKICQMITLAVKTDGFYDEGIFTAVSENMKPLLQKDVRNEPEQIQLNKYALSAGLPDVFTDADSWGKGFTTDILEEMKHSGIDRAWIGLDNWENAFVNPQLAETASQQGYLIGPYDSYHSIHEPGKEEWKTAAFEDQSLYETAVITNRDGSKETGFKGVGRKLNPTLTMPAVRQRVEQILASRLPFNSWFVDCDATGEIFDDYSPEHITTQQQDYQARLERMEYIGSEKGMVVGSEGGNDFASPVIAFAHGIELMSFSWMDEDMKSNKDSEYYIGKYYSAEGGVPEHFKKQIPIKETYRHIFLDSSFDVPLYRLVYNNSVITTYHWDWSTFKIQGEVENRMLREILYNIPPLYHLDKEEWDLRKEDIISHTRVWSEFAKEAVLKEMTDFKYLTEDGLVQMTSYGEQLSVTANFSEAPFINGDTVLEPKSLIIINHGEVTLYSPEVTSQNGNR